jgi:DNA helicase-2/ATP-dependent DNA helicase PcrA
MIQYIEYLKTIEDDVTQREENIQELISSIINFEKSGEVKTIEEYLDKISLYTTSDEQTNKADSVAMMTIHAAKGLEFKIVYVIGMNEGTLPSLKGGDIEEERRISYVAMTRAQELLYLTSAKGYNPIAQSENITSRFINEIKGPHIKYVRNESSVISDLKQN